MTHIERLSLTRLHGEKFVARHEELLAEMHADSRVMATLGGIRSREDHREYMIENIEHWERLASPALPRLPGVRCLKLAVCLLGGYGLGSARLPA